LVGKYCETLTERVMAPRTGWAIENADLTGHAGSRGVHDPLRKTGPDTMKTRRYLM
jgi:hypothetical protein